MLREIMAALGCCCAISAERRCTAIKSSE